MAAMNGNLPITNFKYMKYRPLKDIVVCNMLNDNESEHLILVGDDVLFTEEEKRARQRIRYSSGSDGNYVVDYNQTKKLKVIASGIENVKEGDIIVTKDGVWDDFYDKEEKEHFYFVNLKDIQCVL